MTHLSLILDFAYYSTSQGRDEVLRIMHSRDILSNGDFACMSTKDSRPDPKMGSASYHSNDDLEGRPLSLLLRGLLGEQKGTMAAAIVLGHYYNNQLFLQVQYPFTEKREDSVCQIERSRNIPERVMTARNYDNAIILNPL